MIKRLDPRIFVFAFFASLVSQTQAQPFGQESIDRLHGGLIVQLGASELDSATDFSRTGRYLIHILDSDPQEVQKAQAWIHKEGQYGLAWAEKYDESGRLPYAENMVNLVWVRDFSVSPSELFRVLTPNGLLMVADSKLLTESQLETSGFESISKTGSILIARKPWPTGMDSWSHPRHDSNGNAVSTDTLVGPPERVRWIAAATSEVEGMVSAGGRNFYGGILARDSFNGLRLWHKDLRKPGSKSNDFFLPQLSRDGARPVASDQLVFAVMQNRPVALNARTGAVVVGFGDMVNPTSLVHDGDRIYATDTDSVRAFSIESGKEIWNVKTPEPRNVVTDGESVSLIQGRARRGETVESVMLDAKTGEEKWRRSDYPWIDRATRTVLAKGQLVFEVSTLNDHDADNESMWLRRILEIIVGQNHSLRV